MIVNETEKCDRYRNMRNGQNKKFVLFGFWISFLYPKKSSILFD